MEVDTSTLGVKLLLGIIALILAPEVGGFGSHYVHRHRITVANAIDKLALCFALALAKAVRHGSGNIGGKCRIVFNAVTTHIATRTHHTEEIAT